MSMDTCSPSMEAGWRAEENMALSVRSNEDCRSDLLRLGQVMLRFDPGEYRIRATRHFTVTAGGGEYNVARGWKRCFRLETAMVTALAKNRVGSLLVAHGR